MNMVVFAMPVVFLNPRTKLVDAMPFAMVQAYLPNGTDLNLEDAAKVAYIRDEETAINLLESAIE